MSQATEMQPDLMDRLTNNWGYPFGISLGAFFTSLSDFGVWFTVLAGGVALATGVFAWRDEQ